MNSLIATLLELRIFLISIFVSGALHLTLIGGGWLDLTESPRLGSHSIAITVSASRADLTEATSVTSQEVSAVSVKPAAALSQGSSAPSASSVSKPASKQLISKAAVESVSVPVRQKLQAFSEKAPLSRLPEQRDEPVKKALVATAAQAEPDVQPMPDSPVYQSAPAFRIPPQPPKYPRLARKRGIEGQVIVRADIGQAGDVLSLRIEQSSGSDMLDRAARKAVHQWQFVPAEFNGIKVTSYVRIPVDFVLEPH